MINCGITGSSGVLGKKIRKNLPYKFYCFKKDITNYHDVKKLPNCLKRFQNKRNQHSSYLLPVEDFRARELEF